MWMKRKHIVIIIVILLIDQISKFLIASNMGMHQQIPIIPGFFNITYLINTGAAWSMLEGKMIFFYIISVVALVAMFMFYHHSENEDKLTRLALALMIAGTLGNFIDRLAFQHVRDFLDFIIFGYDFPVFNVADMSLFFGVFLIIADVCLESYGMVRKK